MDKLKQYVLLTVLGAVVIMAAGWFLLVSPKKDEAAVLEAQAAEQVSANALLRTQLEVLQAQAKDLPAKQADLARVAAKIPDNPSLPALIRAVTAASVKAGVDFVSVTPAAPVAVAAAAPVVPVAPADPAAAPAAPVAAVPAPVDPTTGQLASIPVVLNVVGDFFEVEQFVAELENLPRALRVTNLVITPGVSPTDKTVSATASEDGRSLTSTITGSVFMAAGRPPATPVVAPVAAPAS